MLENLSDVDKMVSCRTKMATLDDVIRSKTLRMYTLRQETARTMLRVVVDGPWVVSKESAASSVEECLNLGENGEPYFFR